MQGKVCIVTGANSGIGKETARGLARAGARVIMACRDAVRAKAAREELAADTGGEIETAPLDLASLASIRSFAAAFCERHPRLDVLVNNAGLWSGRRALSRDGFELTFGVNHLGPFLLTHLLRTPLLAAAPARVIVVASAVYVLGRIDFTDLQSERRYGRLRAYAATKLANILFTVELARRLAGTGVTANALHPGAVASNFIRDFSAPVRWAAARVLASPERGARTALWAATAPELTTVSGAYLVARRRRAIAARGRDTATAERLWQVSAELTGIAPPS